MAKQGMATFGFNPITATQEYTMTLIEYEYDEKGKKTAKPLIEELPMKLVLKPGDSYEVSKTDLKKLIAKGKVRSKAAIKERDELLTNKMPLERMSDEERKLVLSDRPMEL